MRNQDKVKFPRKFHLQVPDYEFMIEAALYKIMYEHCVYNSVGHWSSSLSVFQVLLPTLIHTHTHTYKKERKKRTESAVVIKKKNHRQHSANTLTIYSHLIIDQNTIKLSPYFQEDAY